MSRTAPSPGGSCWPSRGAAAARPEPDGTGRRPLDRGGGLGGRRTRSWSSCSSDRPTSGAWPASTRWCSRRSAGEPLQYVLGRWGFRDPRPDGRPPGADPAARDRVGGGGGAGRARPARRPRACPPRCVDLGTGSGAIALSVAVERVRTTVWATDASDARARGGPGQPRRHRPGRDPGPDRARGYWFEALPGRASGATCDLVVSNPPYVATSAELPTRSRLGADRGVVVRPDGTDDLRRIIAGAPGWLADHGVLVCELSPEQGPAMADLAGGYFAQVARGAGPHGPGPGPGGPHLPDGEARQAGTTRILACGSGVGRAPRTRSAHAVEAHLAGDQRARTSISPSAMRRSVVRELAPGRSPARTGR